MIGITIDRSYANIPEKILYKDSMGFTGTIKELMAIKEDAKSGGIQVETELDEVIRLFQNFHVLNDEHNRLYDGWGGSVFIEKPQEFIHTFKDTELGAYRSSNVWQTWLIILRGLNEAIHEFYRYGAKDTDEYIMFLKHVLMFLSYMYVYDHKTMRTDFPQDDQLSSTGLFYDSATVVKNFEENICKKARRYQKH